MAKTRKPTGKIGVTGAKARAAGAPAAKLAPVAIGAHGAKYEILCSECYSDFSFRSGVQAGQITCPECLHVGAVSDGETMGSILVAKRREKKALLLSLVPAVLFLVTAFAWIATATYSAEMPSSGVNYTFSGLTAVFFCAMIAFGIKYEGTRYDVYF